MTSTKPFWLSRTIWINALILLIAMADAARALPLPADWAPWIVAAASVLNVALRLTTNTGIAGVPMRAAPAPQDAPPGEAGAPSLAEQIARDNGLDVPGDHE